MIAYAESSAVLAWLLGEPEEAAIRHTLADAERVVASTLTWVECARALARGVNTERLLPGDELAALQRFDPVSASWSTLELTGEGARSRLRKIPTRAGPHAGRAAPRDGGDLSRSAGEAHRGFAR